MNSTSDALDRDARWTRFAIAAIVAGAIFRLVWGLWIHPPLDHLYSDMAGYVSRARILADGGPYSRFFTFFQPGAHMLLAIPLRIFGSGRGGLWAGSVLWASFSSLVPLISWLWLRRFTTARASAIAAALVAAWPMYITYGGFFLSEIPSLLFLVLTLFLVDRAGQSAGKAAIALGVAAGFSAAVAVAVRHQLLMNVLIAGWVLVFVHRRRRVAAVALVGLVLPLAGLVAFNVQAAGRFVGLSEVGGLNFFLGHCPVHTVHTTLPGTTRGFTFASPVVVQTHRGRDYFFPNHIAWEQSYFVKQGFRCIKEDGLKHVGVLIRNAADLGITSVPWPQSNEIGLRRFVRPSNVAYMMLLPIMVAGGLFLAMRSRARINGPGILFAHLIAMLPFALLFFGDPRYRMAYDVFGLALLAVIVDAALPRRAPVAGETDPP